MIYHFNNTPIFYEYTGIGPTMVLLHGFLESSTMWNWLAPKLEGNYSLLKLDLPGHGKSGCLDSGHTMEQFAEVVYSLLQHLQIPTASFVGHSMGGYVLLALAEKYDEIIDQLVLLNSTTYRDSDDRKANRDRALRFMETQKDTIISMALSNLFTTKARMQFSSEISQLKNEAMQFPSEGITAAIIGMRDRKERTQVLKKFTKSKLMICGREDSIVPLSHSVEIAKTTQTPIKIIDGGHMSWLEQPNEIVKIVYLNE